MKRFDIFCPCLSASKIKDIVLNTADPTYSENTAYAGKLGTGRLDVYEAVKRAIDLGTVYEQNIIYASTTPLIVTSPTDIVAGYNVTTTPYGIVQMQNNTNTIYQAAHAVRLSDDFEVQNGAVFEAKIIDSPCY